MSLYQNNFRIESARLKEWDYTNPWWYFVTINTKNHKEYFGMVKNDEVILSGLGNVVNEEWLNTKLFRSNVELDDYVIMPNHFHGIIILNENCRDVARNVSTTQVPRKFSEISPKANSLSAIIRSFKSAVTKRAHENGIPDFSWQSRFYDRIIRNEKELFFIRRYIQQNPLKWGLEKEEPENIFAL